MQTKDFLQMNILHLVLYSSPYEQMYSLLSPYYKRQPYKTVFYAYSDTIQQEYEWNDDILLVQGTESYVPGILEKTLQVFRYFQHDLHQYDYIVRSNISTIVHLPYLHSLLQQLPRFDYGAGRLLRLSRLDASSGVVDTTWFDTVYGAGTSLLFSNRMILDILENNAKIKRELVDDLSLGVYVREHRHDIQPTLLPSYLIVPNMLSMCSVNRFPLYAFYRNYHGSGSQQRQKDVQQMWHILRSLTQTRKKLIF